MSIARQLTAPLLGLALVAAVCGAEPPALLSPTLGFRLPVEYNSPDGMTLGPDGCIYLSMNNVVKPEYPAKILRIDAQDRMTEVITLPPWVETKGASPLGLAFAADGNLYVADNQAFLTKEPGRSRLLRVVMRNGLALACETVATGLNMANGVACWGDSVYVCETTLGSTAPMPSGVYRFRISELNALRPVAVKGLTDEHMVVKVMTQNANHLVGANGLDFDRQGNMYVCNFGDAEVIKVSFDSTGRVAAQSVLAKGGGMESCDGLHVDDGGNVWVADFLGNAVARISPAGQVAIVVKNGESDGADGSLHSPSEAFVRGNTLYVSNINLAYGPHKSSSIYSISTVQLRGKARLASARQARSLR